MSNKQTIMQLANEVIRYLNACADEAFVESVLECINDGVELGEDEIRDMFPADVASVVHGRWVHHDDGVVTCSECGNAESSESYYCRYCGAKMDL